LARRLLKSVDVSDVFAVAGYGATVYGVALWWVPAAWMCGGVMLIAIAIAPAFRKAKG
jgi:hypothetical protein